MNYDSALLFAFMLVFVRCSAMMLASPVFGAQSTPVQIRVLTTFAISAALTAIIQPKIGPVPTDMYGFVSSVIQELLAGLLIGMFMSLAMQVALIAGAICDLQVGLSMSQAMNPITGVSVTVLSQFKFLLGVVIFLQIDAHHMLIELFVRSYQTVPSLSMSSVPAVQAGLLHLLGTVFLLALQIAAPVMAVSFVVDAGLGIINRAVPQMQAMNVGLPAKIGIGLTAVGLGLPALAGGVNAAVGEAFKVLGPIFKI